jgi:hypothetical protein
VEQGDRQAPSARQEASPSSHFVSLSQTILYRGAGLDAIWPQIIALVANGVFFFAAALIRFRGALADARIYLLRMRLDLHKVKLFILEKLYILSKILSCMVKLGLSIGTFR